MLNTEQIQHYSEQGFLVLPGIVSGRAVELIKSAALRIIDDFDVEHHQNVFSAKAGHKMSDQYFFASASNISCFLEADAFDIDGNMTTLPKSQCINKIGHALELDSSFRDFCCLPMFGDMAKDLGYATPQLIQTMYILKPPRIGGEVRWHQDATYLDSSPSTVMGIWVSVEPANKDNGCLWVQPGGHRSPLREVFHVNHGFGTSRLHALDSTPWPEDDKAIALEVPEGSVVLFNDHLPHYSSHNHSRTSRHAFSMHIKERDAQWHPHNWLQAGKREFLLL